VISLLAVSTLVATLWVATGSTARTSPSPAPGKAPVGDGVASDGRVGDALPVSTAMPSFGGAVGPDGEYRHSLSVDVPSFHGLEPPVGLQYNSSSGNGIAGWGWSLIGDSVIERTARRRGVPAFDSSDVFLLDGNALVPCAAQPSPGPSCTAGGTHSTELEAFQRIEQEGATWSVWDRDGTRGVYLDASPANAPGTRWALLERRNSHGDRLVYHRWCDGGDACYLGEIEYVDAVDSFARTRVRFYYALRPDHVAVGAGPAVIATRYRLTAILVSTARANRNALVLEYWPSSSAPWQRDSQLRYATRYGNDVVLDATGRPTAGSAHPAEYFARVDSGRGTASSHTQQLANQFGPPWTDHGGTSYGTWQDSTALPPGNPATAQRWLAPDVNGDGRADLVAAHRETNAQGVEVIRLRVLRSDRNGGWQHSSQLTPWEMGTSRWRLVPGDYDGDGRADVANVFWNWASNRILAEIALSDGTGGFSLQGQVDTGLTTWDSKSRWMSGDVDGDGRDDLIGAVRRPKDRTYGYPHAGLMVGFTTPAGTISSFVSTVTSWTFHEGDSLFWFVGDRDGDGRADLLRVEQLGADVQHDYNHAGLATAVSNGNGTWSLWRHDTGIPFFTVTYIGRYDNSPQGGDLVHAGDFDGNGKTDLAFMSFQLDKDFVSYWHIVAHTALATDTSGFDIVDTRTDVGASHQNAWMVLHHGEPYYGNRWIAGDVNGDGLTDLMATKPTDPSPGVWPTTLYTFTLIAKGDGTFDYTDKGSSTSIPFDCWNRASYAWGCGAGPMLDVFGGDANGDGRLDLLTARPVSTGSTELTAVLAPNTGLDGHRWLTTDLTGEGHPDHVYVQYTNPGLVVRSSIADPAAQGGRRLVTHTVAGASTFGDADMRHWRAIDVGRPGGGGPDGRADLVHLRLSSAPFTAPKTVATVLLSNGDGTFQVQPSMAVVDPESRPDQRSWLPLDVNGDGLTDLVRTTRSGASGIAVETLTALGDGTWRYRLDQAAGLTGVTGAHRFAPADVNGDGLDDLVHVQLGGVATGGPFTETVITLLGRGDGTWQPVVTNRSVPSREPVASWRPAELNGDGRTDLVRLRRTANGIAIDRLLAAGRGGWEFQVGTDVTVGLLGARWHVLDANGDGLSDVAMLASVLNNEAHLYWAVNTGAGFDLTHAKFPLSSRDVAFWRPADVDADGVSELAVARRSGAAVALQDVTSGWSRPLLKLATNGLGLSTTIWYTSSAGTHAAMPVGAALSVVTLVARGVPAPIQSGPQSVRYSRGGARYDFVRARLLGYETVTAAVGTSEVVTRYRQTRGCAGQPARVETRGAGGLFWTDATDYDDPSRIREAPWSCLPRRLDRTECEQTSACRHVVTGRTHDQYGNLTHLDEYGEFADANGDGVDDVGDDNRHTVTSYAYNTSDYLVSYPAEVSTLDARGAVATRTRTHYDGQSSHLSPPTAGNPTTVLALENGSGRYLATTRTFDSHGNLTRETDPAGRWTTTAWDAVFARFPERQCHALWCTHTSWDAVLGRPRAEVDANGLQTVHSHDVFGRHLRTTYPDGGCLQHAYLGWGTIAVLSPQRVQESYCVVVGGDGNHGTVWLERYVDGLGRVWREDRSGGYRRERSFLSDTGNVVTEQAWRNISDPAVTTRFFYDDAFRPRETRRPDGTATTTRYAVGSVTVLNELGHPRMEARDGLGRVRTVTEKVLVGGAATDVVTTYQHDARDELVAMTDQAGTRTTWQVNSLGWQLALCDPDRGCRRRTFDDAGLLLTETDAAGHRSEHSYDAIGRRVATDVYALTGKRKLTGRKLTDRIRWAHDVDPATNQPLGWSAGQVTVSSRSSQAGTSTERVSYDKRGRPTTVRRCANSRCLEDRTTWDVAGRIFTIEYPDPAGLVSPVSEVVTHHYDAAGRILQVGGYVKTIGYTPDDQIASIAYGNGTTEVVGHDTNRGWPTAITVTGPSGAIAQTSYNSYDRAGRLTGEDRLAPVPFQRLYGYDALDRLTSVRGPNAEDIEHDASGNIVMRTNADSYRYEDPAHPHAVTHTGSNKLSYDTTGNLAADRTRKLTWSPDGRLAKVNTNTGPVQFSYDAAGNRTGKRTPAGEYTYHGRYAEVDPNGTIVRSYWVGDRLVARTALTWGVRYYHHDRLGSPIALTNDTGQLIQAYGYDAFGVRTSQNSQLADDRGFTGARLDEETGLLLLGDRYYDPQLGRFISPDTVVADIRRPQTLNRYAYASNDPVNRVDPTGHTDVPTQPTSIASGSTMLSPSTHSARLVGLLPRTKPGLTTSDLAPNATDTSATVIVIISHGQLIPPMVPHAALWIGSSRGQLLFDPGGSFGDDIRGSGQYYVDEEFDLPAYIAYQESTSSSVSTYRFSISQKDATQIWERIAPSDGTNGIGGEAGECSIKVCEALAGVGPFRDLGSHFLPSDLEDELISIQSGGGGGLPWWLFAGLRNPVFVYGPAGVPRF
jgi:RHS repeat-associated protein